MLYVYLSNHTEVYLVEHATSNVPIFATVNDYVEPENHLN